MKQLLVDTDILISFANQDIKTSQFFDNHKDNIVLTYITVGEFLQGAKNKDNMYNMREFVDQFQTDLGSRDVNKMAISILSDYRLKHGLGFFDALIAATAISNDSILVTKNAKHFKFIPHLQVKRIEEI